MNEKDSQRLDNGKVYPAFHQERRQDLTGPEMGSFLVQLPEQSVSVQIDLKLSTPETKLKI